MSMSLRGPIGEFPRAAFPARGVLFREGGKSNTFSNFGLLELTTP
jgi:hypothetical protein